MKLRILRRSLNQFENIVSAATQCVMKGRFSVSEPAGRAVSAPIEIEVDDAIVRAVSEEARRQLMRLEVTPDARPMHAAGGLRGA